MKTPPSGPGIGASQCAPGTGIDHGGRRMLVFIGLSLILHIGLLGIVLRQPQHEVPATLVQESRLDLRLRPREVSQAATLPSVPKRLVETTPPRPDRSARPVPLSAHPRSTTDPSARSDTAQATRSDTAAGDDSVAVPPPIDYAAARETARQAARSPRQAKPAFEIPTPPPAEPETELGKDIQRSVHPDCRSRYAGAGLLAIPLLINDAVREGGCRW